MGSVIQHKPGSSFLRDLSAHKHARKQQKQGGGGGGGRRGGIMSISK